MLNIFIHNFFFKKSVKTGLYIDYISKKIAFSWINNVFNWASLYVLEKFVVEYLSRYLLNYFQLEKLFVNKIMTFNYINIVYMLFAFAFIIL